MWSPADWFEPKVVERNLTEVVDDEVEAAEAVGLPWREGNVIDS
jgi:ABC-type methionine transport system permease subunit